VFYLYAAHVCNSFQLFLQMFQIHISSVPSFFFYVASVVSKCFKSRLGCCTWGARGEEGGGTSGPARATLGGIGPCVGAGDAGAIERCLHGVGPCMDARNGGRKPTAAAGVRPDVWALDVS
jgi:hypothetical protein